MDVGLLLPFRNPARWHVPWPAFYADQLDQIVEAEQLGYGTAWLSEHHFADDGYSPSLMTIAAAIAARTSTIRIGTFLALLPLHHPVRLAEDAATVDVLSNGRLDLGLGQGYVPGEFAGFGIPRRERGSRFVEGLEVVRGLWTRPGFSYARRHVTVSDATLMPPPVQRPHPPLWIGAEQPVGIERAARLGCNFLSNGDPTHQQRYDETLRAEGHDPAAFAIAQLQWCYVAPTREQAWDDVSDHLHHMLAVYRSWAIASGDPTGRATRPLPDAGELRTSPLASRALIGTPDEVTERIHAFTGRVRTTHLVLGMHMAGLGPSKLRASMTLFAGEVLPHL